MDGKTSGQRLEPLSEKAGLIYKKLKSLEPHEAMKTPQILDWFFDEHGKNLDEGEWSKRIRKELLPYGLQNKPQIGYFFP